MKTYDVIVCYKGSMLFSVEANSEEEAKKKAIKEYENTSNSEIVANLSDVDFSKITVMNKFEPCPFCGSREIEIMYDDETRQLAVVCNYQKGGCGASSGYYSTESEAINAWNRRAERHKNCNPVNECNLHKEQCCNSGLVYPFFKEGVHTYSEEINGFSQFFISCGYGTVNPCSMGLWGERNGIWYRISEFYHDSRAKGFQMTDSEYYEKLCSLAGNRKINAVIVDPSAASFIECIHRGGKFNVIPAKNDVAYGIRKVSEFLKNEKIKIHVSCADAIREFSLYRWDETTGRDAPKKENDRAMDDIRYFVTLLK